MRQGSQGGEAPRSVGALLLVVGACPFAFFESLPGPFGQGLSLRALRFGFAIEGVAVTMKFGTCMSPGNSLAFAALFGDWCDPGIGLNAAGVVVAIAVGAEDGC